MFQIKQYIIYLCSSIIFCYNTVLASAISEISDEREIIKESKQEIDVIPLLDYNRNVSNINHFSSISKSKVRFDCNESKLDEKNHFDASKNFSEFESAQQPLIFSSSNHLSLEGIVSQNDSYTNKLDGIESASSNLDILYFTKSAYFKFMEYAAQLRNSDSLLFHDVDLLNKLFKSASIELESESEMHKDTFYKIAKLNYIFVLTSSSNDKTDKMQGLIFAKDNIEQFLIMMQADSFIPVEQIIIGIALQNQISETIKKLGMDDK